MKHDHSEKIPLLRTQRKKCCLGCPKRWLLILLGFFGFFNAQAIKVNLSVAIVAMVKKQDRSDGTEIEVECLELLKEQPSNSSSLYPDGDFDWDASTQSMILGAFFYGYVITQIPSGIFAEKYGSKWLYGAGVFIASVLTLITPFAAFSGVWPLIILRVIEGLAVGVTHSTMNALLGIWAPKNERTRMSALIYCGSSAGSVVPFALSGIISDTLGWPFVFYIVGILGIFWTIFWICLVYETPELHPCITEKEIEHIRRGQDTTGVWKGSSIPWKEILTSRYLWALVVTHFGQNWGFYTLLTELPTYLAEILHFDMKKNGLLSALPYLVEAFLTITSSFIADYMRASGRFRITTIRKWFNSIGFFCPALCIVLVAYLGCRPTAIVIVLVVSAGLNGFCNSGYRVTHVDMSPEFAGILLGITNCIANFSGVLAPAYVGFITQKGHTLDNWKIVFLTTSVIYVVTGLVYIFFCSAELQPWGTIRPTGKGSVDKHDSNMRTAITNDHRQKQTDHTSPCTI